jgi:protocatechuate 3,4-dioxygenase beta subunit
MLPQAKAALCASLLQSCILMKKEQIFMDNDDQQIGRVLSRREVLALLGTAGATLLMGCGPTQSGSTATTAPATPTAAPAATAAAATPALNAEAATTVAMAGDPTAAATATTEVATAVAANAVAVPNCVVRPEVTEGPYYVDEDLVRSDIRTDPSTGTAREGTPLVLTFNLAKLSNGSCAAYEGATVDVWHCDAVGQYSDVTDRRFDTKGQKWLRGTQVTDANGQASFTTIYPGWYAGRAVHIHYKVYPADTSKVFTSQLFFDPALSEEVFAQAPYSTKGTTPDTPNSTDSIYQDLMLLTVTKTDQGYASTFEIGVQEA